MCSQVTEVVETALVLLRLKEKWKISRGKGRRNELKTYVNDLEEHMAELVDIYLERIIRNII